jgi:transposase InsO family protein
VRPLQPVISSYPNETVSFDLFGPFLATNEGYQYLEVATDLFSKFIMLRPLKDATAKSTAETMVQWVLRYGAPTKVLTDRGPHYTAEALRETARLMNVNKVYSTAGHHETVGQCERLVKTITGLMLATWTDVEEWVAKYCFYEYAYNVSWHPAIDTVPWFLWFGRLPAPLVELENSHDARRNAWRFADRRAYARDTLDQLLEAVRHVRHVHQRVKAQMKDRHDRSLQQLVNLSAGDLCWWYDEHVPRRSPQLPAKRLFAHWKGPYFVRSLEGQNAVIRDAQTLEDKKVHRNLLRRYLYPLAGLDVEGRRRGAYVRKVLDQRGQRNAREYLVEWRGPDGSEEDWLSEEMTPANLVEEYEDRIVDERRAQRARRS